MHHAVFESKYAKTLYLAIDEIAVLDSAQGRFGAESITMKMTASVREKRDSRSYATHAVLYLSLSIILFLKILNEIDSRQRLERTRVAQYTPHTLLNRQHHVTCIVYSRDYEFLFLNWRIMTNSHYYSMRRSVN